jgi:hypothetical protein
MTSVFAVAARKDAAIRAPNASQLQINLKPCATRGRRLRDANAVANPMIFAVDA